jgi:hypothetical protein
VPGHVDADRVVLRADREHLGLTALVRPQPRPHPRDDLLGLERLDHVVVRTALEPQDHIGGVALGRQHDDRNPALGPDLPADLQPVGAGQHQVEQHDVGLLPAEGGQGEVAVGHEGRLEVLAAQHDAEHLGKRRVVIDHEHTCLDHGNPRLLHPLRTRARQLRDPARLPGCS